MDASGRSRPRRRRRRRAEASGGRVRCGEEGNVGADARLLRSGPGRSVRGFSVTQFSRVGVALRGSASPIVKKLCCVTKWTNC